MTDEKLASLASLPNHVHSFSLDVKQGTLIEATRPTQAQAQAQPLYTIVKDVGTLLARQWPAEETPVKMRSVTVAFGDRTISATVSEDKVYVMERD
ncbi:hypothetical protein BZG36_03648 [Bifiguratus adelaidae]|uniref:Uncharacterized protein n=1 Tax=Bifiguratus adelaidae TaxID=1938954 RepID=A0A261XW33_9FUNG|nr:hypothetical protein BZG36_03648 [Bifiguratus adelaidae]